MKKYFLTAVCLLWGESGFAATVQGYIVAACNDTQNTYQTRMCNDTTLNCGSSSAMVAPSSGAYSSYNTCGAFSVDGLSYKLLICFSDANECRYTSKCGDDYSGTLSKLSLSSTSVGTRTTVSNYAFFTCCQTCTESGWYDLVSNNRPYQRNDLKVCSNTGVCSNSPRWYVRCPENYYNSDGWSQTMNMAATNVLPTCISCDDATGASGAESDAGSAAITDCYAGPNAELSDSSGPYVFDSKCYYSK